MNYLVVSVLLVRHRAENGADSYFILCPRCIHCNYTVSRTNSYPLGKSSRIMNDSTPSCLPRKKGAISPCHCSKRRMIRFSHIDAAFFYKTVAPNHPKTSSSLPMANRTSQSIPTKRLMLAEAQRIQNSVLACELAHFARQATKLPYSAAKAPIVSMLLAQKLSK
mmetsp:Transcript_950/g.2223  ORF Transcript_950/g.2223 Transcript_950/m.2223 type:complete len:165 (+) Transcript_950:594-1088(+)